MAWIHHFREGEADGSSRDRELLGGKGADLAEMSRLGVPVPPGFTISTEACRLYLEEGGLPDAFWSEVDEAVRRLEEVTGRRFGEGDFPLLLSARSGAPVSMPGMMDTVLNLGLNDGSAERLARATGNEAFALDSLRRLLQMYGEVVLEVDGEGFEEILTRRREAVGAAHERELPPDAIREVIREFRELIADRAEHPFPDDPREQLRESILAVFGSWNGPRARAYRRAERIPDTLGTAVNIQSMVFGNLGEDCAAGVAFTRNPSTGERKLYGEFLVNAQGEDVVAGTRDPLPIEEMEADFPEAHAQLGRLSGRLEAHYREMLDLEFTIERKRLFLLQSRTGKRTAQAAVRIAVEMLDEGLISEEEAVLRVEPRQVERLLHPSIDPEADAEPFLSGLPASPGAAAGVVVFDPDEAERRAGEEGADPVILVRAQTSPDDFHGMAAAAGILTARGGMTSHAAVVARGMGKPCVAGAHGLEIDRKSGVARAGGREVREGDWITLDGATGRVFEGRVPTVPPQPDERFERLMELADRFRRLGVRANADTPEDARRARALGAEGIGLCRTEHMFFQEGRIAAVRRMILADDDRAREAALAELLPLQRRDFLGIFREMDGLPVTVRLLDPPLHEFLPPPGQDLSPLADSMGLPLETVEARVDRLREANPMLGHRGVRLGLTHPAITRMQVKALCDAACDAMDEGLDPHFEVMVPLVAHVEELRRESRVVREAVRAVAEERGRELDVKVGTMIELPRAALTAGEIAEEAAFFSFGTNDLTQTVLGVSRDDATGFLPWYLEEGIFSRDPFLHLDRSGVGRLMEIAVREGRAHKPDLQIGLCGEHGGDAASVAFCHPLGMDYVSCSPFRVPVARLAAAHAALAGE
jgi:pyruvate, orthophosphate dikinase